MDSTKARIDASGALSSWAAAIRNCSCLSMVASIACAM